MRLCRVCLVTLVAIAGCGHPSSTRRAGASDRHVGTFRAVSPTDYPTAANAAGQALILGTDPRGGATAVPLVGGLGAVTVDSITLTTRPATAGTDGTIRTGGLGPAARAEVGMAAYVATSVLGKDVTDFDFTADARRPDDGLSASALMTAGYLAAMLGRAIDPHATVIGVVNLDGTIGVVDDVPQALDAAIAAGQQRIGYPLGVAPSGDLETRARARGVTAVAIADVYGALELLTGTALPRPIPVDDADMALEPAVTAALAARYDGWHQRLAGEWTQVLELQSSGRLPASLAALVDRAEHEADRADRLRQRGQAAAAYDLVVRAWIDGASATAVAAILAHVRAGDLAAARARLDELAAMVAIVDDSLRTIGQVVPDTLGGHLQMMSAFADAIAGWSFRDFADHQVIAARDALAALDGAPPAALMLRATTDDVAAAIVPAVRGVARAVAGATMATETLAIERDTTMSYTGSPPGVDRLAASFGAIARANLAAFEARFVADAATTPGRPLDAARREVATDELGYMNTIMIDSVDQRTGWQETLTTSWGAGSIAASLFRLAATEASFVRTSLLVSRYASLAEPQALTSLLTWAERRAREEAHAARVATGAIPVQARLRYQVARALADGDRADQLEALAHYWAASLFSQTAVMLARDGA